MTPIVSIMSRDRYNKLCMVLHTNNNPEKEKDGNKGNLLLKVETIITVKTLDKRKSTPS